jgi:hypothetical protein
MSLMTESLLLEAQSLRLEGDMHTSIDLLRTVLSQCDSDIKAAASAALDGAECEVIAADTIKAVWRMRQLAAYQLALLLLQRDGRCYYMKYCNTTLAFRAESTSDDEQSDEKEAEDLLSRLGYKMRLTTRAFGYPSCCCRYNISISSFSDIPCRMMDDVLPSQLFEALQSAFRPDSRYWTELYSKVNSDNDSSWLDDRNRGPTSTKRNQFVSHNIELPPDDPHPLLLQALQSAKSIIEQVAIITKYKLIPHFPELKDAQSVEVWCHRRPIDGSHQLHYDMDEIRLQERRERLLAASTAAATQMQQKTKRQKVDASDTHNQGKNDGVFCPMVSCVLTIYVPSNSHTCLDCGETFRAAPTIVCNQSILNHNQTQASCQSNDHMTGWLCYPKPNRLLAFEGSLLHGVVPGIPELNGCVHGSESDSAESYDGYSNTNNQPQRVTLMMGFWADGVRTQGELGPNMPLPNINGNHLSWTSEFTPIKIKDLDELQSNHSTDSTNTAIEVNPLWKPIHSSTFGEYANDDAMQFSGRFFLRSDCTSEIDDEVLHTTTFD